MAKRWFLLGMVVMLMWPASVWATSPPEWAALLQAKETQLVALNDTQMAGQVGQFSRTELSPPPSKIILWDETAYSPKGETHSSPSSSNCRSIASGVSHGYSTSTQR
jgi:hypothetical protein